MYPQKVLSFATQNATGLHKLLKRCWSVHCYSAERHTGGKGNVLHAIAWFAVYRIWRGEQTWNVWCLQNIGLLRTWKSPTTSSNPINATRRPPLLALRTPNKHLGWSHTSYARSCGQSLLQYWIYSDSCPIAHTSLFSAFCFYLDSATSSLIHPKEKFCSQE